jgi:hypothetical protein
MIGSTRRPAYAYSTTNVSWLAWCDVQVLTSRFGILNRIMPQPTTEQFENRFAVGLTLDHLWSETMGLPVDDKEKVLACTSGDAGIHRNASN